MRFDIQLDKKLYSLGEVQEVRRSEGSPNQAPETRTLLFLIGDATTLDGRLNFFQACIRSRGVAVTQT